jgi:hypothetical protein
VTRSGWLSSVFLLLGAVAGCVQRGGACSLIGCTDQVSLAIHRADWSRLSLGGVLDIGGRKVTCPALNPPQTRGSCDTDVTIEVRELADCREAASGGAVSQTCTPNGRFELVVTIRGTPPRVVVTLTSGATMVAQRSFELAFTSSRPNGPGCEPVCRQSSERWELPVDPGDAGAADVALDSAADSADSAGGAPGDAPGEGRPDAAADTAGNVVCGTIRCSSNDVCVRRQTAGGACLPVGDAGCPAGSSPGGPCCVADPSFACAPRPAGCGSGLSCACAASALCTSGFNCSTSGNDQIRCTLLAP